MSVPAERRRFRRYEIELPGRVGPHGGRPRDCVVRDYCSGGMLLQLPDATASEKAFEIGQAVRLGTEVLADSGQGPLGVSATVCWVSGSYLGIAFVQPSEEIVEALRRHDRIARGTAPAGASGSAPGGEARCLAKLRHVAQGALPAILRELLMATTDSLLETADSVTSNTEQQQMYGDLNALEELRRGDLLIRAILDRALDQAAAGKQEAHRAGELALVDTDDFERWLEASRTATALERRYSGQLGMLGARLAAVRGAAAPDVLSVPFEPQHFTTAIKDTAKQLELGATTRGVLFDCARRVLGEQLSGFYAGLDAALDAMGAPAAQSDPKIVILRRPGPRAAEPAPARAAARGSAPVEAAAEQVGGAGGAALTPRRQPPHGQLAAVDPALLDALLQRETRERESLAGEMMNMVSDAPGMTESMAAWMQQLREALVREAVEDAGFFQNHAHPLRSIVDGLGHLQLFRANPDLSPADDPLRQQVSELLAPIGRGEVDDARLRSIADDVARLTDQQSRQYQRNVERVAEASEGRDRVRRARKAVVEELNRRYAGRMVPEVVPELLDVGWRAVLELGQLNAPGGVDGYREQLGLLDGVVALLGGQAVDAESSAFDRRLLLERIEAELATAAFDPFRRNAVESRLRNELADPPTAPAGLVEMPVLQDGDARPAAALRPEGVSEQAWRRALETCAAIGIGDRIRFVDATDGYQELRVAWIRGDREAYALVDHRGLKARDIGLARLALDVHLRRIRLDATDGKPLSERAVDSMLERMEERLAHQAAHDSLTGLINRKQFQAALEQALAVPNRAAGSGVLLWADIDQFRLINDIHGYETGDRLLVAVARQLEQARGAKVLGHLGGDRFAILLPDLALADGDGWAQELCGLIREMPFDWYGQKTNLSLSVGVVSLPAAGQGIDSLMRAAENALLAAKGAGGDQAYVYHDDDPDIARRQESVQWVVQVDEALVNGELHLRCQPIVPVRPDQGLAPHYEVLLGVASGAAQALPVAEFIEAAERYNRMRAVDRWVAKTVIDWIAANRAQMPLLHGFAVNLSGQTASDPDFVDFARQQFKRSGIDPSWVSFEVTETAAVSDLSRTAGIIRELKAMGCKVALDDFGSGLASYSYLKELPVDWLKIDGVFVRKIAADREDYAVVKSINDIGHFLGKQTIAEYVVDEPTLKLVREIGVDFAQGYGISPPMLLDELLASLQTG